MDHSIEWWRWIVLAAIFGALFGAWWWINRGKISWKNLAKPPNFKMRILERQWISHHVTLFLVEVGREQFLLARTQGHVAWQKLESAESSSLASEGSRDAREARDEHKNIS